MIQSTGMLRNDRANEMPLKGKQYLSPFWAAGLSFSRGHRITNVPNDKYMDFLFDGIRVHIKQTTQFVCEEKKVILLCDYLLMVLQRFFSFDTGQDTHFRKIVSVTASR